MPRCIEIHLISSYSPPLFLITKKYFSPTGQRDKPFVSESDMRLRTPRPDILSVPPNNKYYDGLKEAESKVKFY